MRGDQERNGGEAVRRRIVGAARECFARRGVRGTTMEHVAETAQLGRPTLYRFVSGRADLIELVILRRLSELGRGWRRILGEPQSFADTLVEISIAVIESVRSDPELRSLFETTTSPRLISLLAGPRPAVREYIVEYFKERFDQARNDGELRQDVSDSQLVHWICGVYLILFLREDLEQDDLRATIELFLLPSLVDSQAGRALPLLVTPALGAHRIREKTVQEEGPEEAAFQRRLQVLQHARRTGNVSETCRVFGISRTRFYEWRRRAEADGVESLRPTARRPPQMPNATPGPILEALLALAADEPTAGCRRLAEELGRSGHSISKTTVQKLLVQHGLGRQAERLARTAVRL